MPDEKPKSNLTTTIVISVIALLTGGWAVFLWHMWSAHGDTPVIMSDGGSNTFVRFRHFRKTWQSSGSGGFTTALTSDNWRIFDLADELTNANATITIPNAASVTFSQTAFTITPASGVTCTNNVDPEVVRCDKSNTIDLGNATVQIGGHTHRPIADYTAKHFFVFMPE